METRWSWVLVLAAGLGLFLALLAPLCAAFGLEAVARPIYWLYSHFCHQRPERTLWLAGHPMAFCARDMGVYGGIWLGTLIFSIWRHRHFSGKAALLLALPLILDGGTQLIGLRESTNLLRVVTGLTAGAAAALHLLPKMNSYVDMETEATCRPGPDNVTLNLPCREI